MRNSLGKTILFLGGIAGVIALLAFILQAISFFADNQNQARDDEVNATLVAQNDEQTGLLGQVVEGLTDKDDETQVVPLETTQSIPEDATVESPTTEIPELATTISETPVVIATATNQVLPTWTSLAISPTLDYFTVEDANNVVMTADCNYWTPPMDIYADDADRNAIKEWDTKQLPAGVIVGDAIYVEIDGNILSENGTFFFIPLPTPGNGTLRIRDGAFFVVQAGDAEGALRIRERNLECRGTIQQVIRYP